VAIQIDGLVSGLDTTGIRQELLQRRPVQRLQNQIASITEKRAALGTLTAKLLALQGRADKITEPDTFKALTVGSSNPQVLAASADTDLLPGKFRFRIKQLAQSEQFVSSGFSSATALVGAGTLTLETGNGFIDRKTDLDILNGGKGVRRGSIRITNCAGVSSVVDLSTAVTLDDVVEEISNTSGLNVSARIAGATDTNPREALVLVDNSGGAGSFKVEEVGGGHTALDLGVLTSVAATTIQGNGILSLGGKLGLDFLNDGNGVNIEGGQDLVITKRNGDPVTINLVGSTTVQDVIDKVKAADADLTLTVSASDFVLTDTSAVSGTTRIANGTSTAAADLGLLGSSTTGTLTGGRVLADANSVLVKTLKGISSLTLGSISITDRGGTTDTISLANLETVQEVIDAIDTGATNVTAGYNSAGNGLLLTDTSGGSGSFSVNESGSTTAADLGILNVAGVLQNQIVGSDLDPQYISKSTHLDTLNGGSGVFKGKIRITDGLGESFELDFSQDADDTIADIINDININASTLVASINDDGNGIKLTDTTGTGPIKVEEVGGGTTAADLGLLGEADAGTPLVLDGSFEKTLTISGTDTLDDVATAINGLGLRIRASIISDGSPLNPARLQLSGRDTGALSRVLVNPGGGTDLSFTRTAAARDAVAFLGSADGESQPLLARSRTNTFKNVVTGLTVTALDTSDTPVVITATQDSEKVKESITDFLKSYNDVISEINSVTRFDAELNVRGELFADSITRTIERSLESSVTRLISELPAGRQLAANVGLRFEADGRLSFDSSDFDDLFESDPDAVIDIFTKHRTLTLTLSTQLADIANGLGISPVGGADIEITVGDGTKIEVDFSGVKTIGELLGKIDAATDNNGKVTAEISTVDGRSLVFRDRTGVTTSDFEVKKLHDSGVAAQLGIDHKADVSGGVKITGKKLDRTNDRGVGLRIFEALEGLLNAQDGAVTRRSNNFQDEVEEIQKRIEGREELISRREELLRLQFARLESSLAMNQQQVARLGALSGGGLSFI
jgi:flagellar hook-associated protein 2